MKHLKSLKIIVLSLIILISFSSCSKDDMARDEQNAAITVSLKSDTEQLNTVFLEINDVQIKVKEDGNLPNAWISLNAINTGTHNISNLTNASELLLVEHFEMNPTFIHEIRLVLGDNNSIKINDTSTSLSIAENASVSNLVKMEFDGNHIYQVVINLDIDGSVSFNEDENTMILNPKLYTEIRKF
ncbi:DUF4382 domain-containing protein [Winogradskyella forsetii]|uniref:DUF4382 domain-containing protein n=1 Tax=Winogradskyella forsetii TaxID=2686077 RepID=UPI0015BA2FB2|nr:DUF4382 domain-containing protein [Winogradskyella forsetii]